jgi:mutual gliding-motility protein MglA
MVGRYPRHSVGGAGLDEPASLSRGTIMPVIQHTHKQIQLKIVYYGPGMGGKTTNLKFLHAHSRPEMRGKLLSLATESERTIFFDLLPVELGLYRGYTVRLHLCTVPGQIALDATRKLVLRHVDGVVFVADSQALTLDANIESIRNLELNLTLQGDDPARMPLAVQYNKRDLPDILAVDELHELLGVPDGVPEFEACAREGLGVPETLKAILKSCLKLVGDPVQAREGRTQSILPGVRASMFPGGRPSVLEMPAIPPPARLPTTRRHVPPTTRGARDCVPTAKTPSTPNVRVRAG